MVQLFKPSFFQPQNVNGVPLSGGLLYFYATGTTTLLTVYTNSTLATPNTNPVVADASGIFAPVYLAEEEFKVVLKTSAGVTVQTIDPYLSGTGTSGSDVQSVYLDVAAATAATIASGVKQVTTVFYASANSTGGAEYIRVTSQPSHAGRFRSTDRYLPNGNVDASNGGWWELIADPAIPEMFGGVADLDAGNTNNATALQNWVTFGITTKRELYAEGRYSTASGLTANGSVRIRLGKGSEIHFSALGANANGFTITGDDFSMVGDEAVVSGPSSASYVANENGFDMLGTSTSVRLSGLTIRGVEIKLFGAHGIYAQFVNDINIDGNYIHDIGYAGAMFLSCDHGRFNNNRIKTITPGTSSNMYGISLTHDSTAYNLDSDANTKQADNPFCGDWYVAFNSIEDIAWEGIDTHGVYETTINYNHVYDTKHGISVTESSGDADNYAGSSNTVSYNVVDGRNKDGTVAAHDRRWLSYGINLNGGSSTSANPRVVCQGNIILYKGVASSSNVGAIQMVLTTDCIVANNVVDQWKGNGIVATGGGGIIADNVFGAQGGGTDTQKVLILDDSPTTYRLAVTGNVHNPKSGTAATYGFKQLSGPTYRPVLDGNDFAACTTPFDLGTAGFSLGSNITPVVNPTSVSGTNTIPLAEVQGQDCLVRLAISSGNYNVTTWSGMKSGQRVTVFNEGASQATFVNGATMLTAGGGNIAVGVSDIIQFVFYGGIAYQAAAVVANA